MNKQVLLAGVIAWVADMVYGLVVWVGLLGPDMARHTGVFRTEEAMNANMPMAFGGALVGMIVLAMIYAKGYEGRSGVSEGFRFGLLMAIFMTGFISIGLYASFNIDAALGLRASIASFIEMVFVGTVMGLAYRPAGKPAAVASPV